VGALVVLVAVLAAVAVTRVVDQRDAGRRAQGTSLPGPITTVVPTDEAEADPMVLPTTDLVPTAEPTTEEAPAAAEPEPDPVPAGPVPLGIAAVAAVDPGGDRAENDDASRRVIDRSPRSAWATEEYKDSGFGGKDGVGLVLRLDAPARVTSVVVRSRPTGAVVQVFALRGDPPETAPRGWEEASAEVELERPRTRIRVERRRPATTLLLWITRLPGPNGANAVEIADVRVLGEPRGA
jgi:putative peptidoglycan lipid II flippase